jgi:hypothetical protein
VRETVGAAENVILGVLLDKADAIYPLTIAEHIADALRDVGLLREPSDDHALSGPDAAGASAAVVPRSAYDAGELPGSGGC